jgi:hypothetical protein
MSGWPVVSVLFITYKRMHLLRRSLDSFLQHTDYPNLELVVTDDGSPRRVQTEIRALPVHKVVISNRNRGTGANTNAGLRACAGQYILSLQDDWECFGPPGYLRDSVELLESCRDIGFVKFYGLEYPAGTLTTVPTQGTQCRLIRPGRSTEPLARNIYSDTPHLKSRQFVELLGFYKEGCTMEATERDFQDRFLCQARLAAALFPQYYNSVFVHIGEKESFRTNSRQYRFERLIAPYANELQRRNSTLFTLGRSFYRKAITILAGEGLRGRG